MALNVCLREDVQRLLMARRAGAPRLDLGLFGLANGQPRPLHVDDGFSIGKVAF